MMVLVPYTMYFKLYLLSNDLYTFHGIYNTIIHVYTCTYCDHVAKLAVGIGEPLLINHIAL